MKLPRILVIIALLLSTVSQFAQITNTRDWRKSERDSLDNAILLYDEKNFLLAFPIFDKIYHNHPNEVFLKYTYAKCALLRPDRNQDAYEILGAIYKDNKKVENIRYDLAKAAHLNNHFDEANKLIDEFIVHKRTKPEMLAPAQQLKKWIGYAIYFTGMPTNAVIKNVGDKINTPFNEYVPTITADESMMIFTHTGNDTKGEVQEDGHRPEDVYVSVKRDDQWTKPVAIDSINTDLNDAAISLNHDGTILYVYRDNGDDHGDIYQSNVVGESFTKPVKLRGQVNSYSWDGHCSLAPDGRTLYFTSERPGGYGGRDLYKATLLPDSSWGNVVNLGDSINTSMNEDAPYIHPDGVTLYYSSSGKTSMGGYDIFEAIMGPDSTFKNAKNLGYPINSTDDDKYFVLSAAGNNGYYSSGKHGGQGLEDIYLIETNFSNKKNVLLVKGKTMSDKTPVESKIKVENMTRGTVFKSTHSNVNTGQYFVTLPKGADYKITYTYLDKAPDVFTVSATDIVGYNEKVHDAMWDTLRIPVGPTLATVPSTMTEGPDDNWTPKTKMQEKIMKYTKKFGDISAPDLEFRVQIAAYKFPKNYVDAHLKGLGKTQRLLLDDGITRITIGGSFTTIRKAWEHNKKVIGAGQTDAFVTALYKGKRVMLEDLIKMGIYIEK
jgi:Tol biopolymer transport system component